MGNHAITMRSLGKYFESADNSCKCLFILTFYFVIVWIFRNKINFPLKVHFTFFGVIYSCYIWKSYEVNTLFAVLILADMPHTDSCFKLISLCYHVKKMFMYEGNNWSRLFDLFVCFTHMNPYPFCCIASLWYTSPRFVSKVRQC